MSFHAFATGRFIGPQIDARCVLGRSGVCAADAKREGDGATPLGAWPLRRVLYRPDREAAPKTMLPATPLTENSGWCDAPEHPAYNTEIRHPFPASAEWLWREDGLYDLIVVLGFNDAPAVPGHGSAIFWHLAQPDWRATEGCVATSRETMLAALSAARPSDVLTISA